MVWTVMTSALSALRGSAKALDICKRTSFRLLSITRGWGVKRWSDRACCETQAVPGGMLCVRMSSGAEEAVTRHLMWRDLLRFVG